VLLFVDGVRDRISGILLGTAIGDALGLPSEGMTRAAIARANTTFDRYRLFGRTGFVSDDTEQSALVAQSLSVHPGDRAAFRRAFRRALLGWFLRLPWGIGIGTLRACVRIALGLRHSGVASAKPSTQVCPEVRPDSRRSVCERTRSMRPMRCASEGAVH
jgi:ADP-ribosylglycohydrolase